jgi:trigger factor
LKTSVEKLEGNSVRLTTTVEAADVDRIISEAYTAAAKKLRIPGFRPGHAPRPVIDTHVGGDYVLNEALEQLVSETYPLAMDELDLRAIDRPDFGELDNLVAGQEYTWSAEVVTKPQMEISSSKDLAVTVEAAKATDAEIDAQIEYLRDRFATLEPVKDRGVAADDFTLISFIGTVDGEPYEGNIVDKYLYEMGKGQMPPEFDAALIGHAAGDRVKVEFTVPDTGAAEFVGKGAGFDVTIHEIKSKSLPAVDDEFASNVGGFETAEELKTDIRTRLDENKAVGHTRMVEREARSVLSERLVGDVPDVMVDSRTESLTEEFFASLKERGISMEEYIEATGVAIEQIQEDIAKEARLQVREELALEALARSLGMDVTEEDIAEELARNLDEGETPEQLREQLRLNGALPLLREQIARRKAVRWLMDNVTVNEEVPGAAVKAEAEAKPKKKPAKKAAPKAGKEE